MARFRLESAIALIVVFLLIVRWGFQIDSHQDVHVQVKPFVDPAGRITFEKAACVPVSLGTPFPFPATLVAVVVSRIDQLKGGDGTNRKFNGCRGNDGF